MSDTQAVATVKIDNPEVRVTEWRFAPGAHTAITGTSTRTWWCRS